MKKQITIQSILLIFFLFPMLNWAQSISGKILDQDKVPLEYVAVAILNPEDSILISYATTGKEGAFELKQIPEGKVVFQVHLLGYKTYQRTIDFKNKPISTGDIILEFENALDEVIVTAVVPISIKTDTIAFNTKAFKIRVEDTAEDLLKKLPGVEVDASGVVTAQGEEITKIYVDGKEFFSGDPLIATKNLSADAIKSIEVIDEKSEKARVSGVNDAVRNKVINIKLKDDKKVSDFGKVQGGYGTDDRYLTSLNYNRFSSKLQTSIIGKLNNVNTSGSDISEVIQFNGGRGGSNSNAGFLTTGVAGINMGYEFKKDQNLNADYFYNYTDRVSGDVIRDKTEFINDTEIKSRSNSRSENTSNSNKVNFSYRDRSDKLKSLAIRGSGNVSNNKGFSKSESERDSALGELDLVSESSSNSNGNNNSGQVSFDLTKRFNENSKRHISTSGSVSISNSDSESNNNQTNTYNISDPANDSSLIINKSQERTGSALSYDLDYTEPITENHLIEFEVDIDYSTSDEDVDQSRIETGVVGEVPLIYSEYYDRTSLSGEVKYIYDKERFTFSTSARFIEQTQMFGLENESDFKKSYTNINPEISIRYNKERSEFFRFRARKRVNLPSLSQISPAVNNFNPLRIRSGNTDLTPEDNYSIFVMYGKHNLVTGFSLFTRISYDYTENSIGNYNVTNQLGVRNSNYENLGDRNSFSSSFSFGNRVSSLGLRYRIRLGGNYNEYYSLIGFEDELGIINSDLNETKSKVGNLSLSLENNKKDKLDASIGATWNQNFTTFISTSGTSSNRDYFQQTYWTKLDWNVTNRFTVNSQFKYDIYTDSSFPTDQAVPIWNATISYAITKSKDLTVMLSALDILNKNIGLERVSNDNYFEEVNRDVLGNYYMLSLTYNLNGNKGKGDAKPSENRRGRRRRRS